MKKNKEKLIRVGLANEINELETTLINYYNTLQLVNEDGLIDYYSFLIKAYEAKHKYLMKKFKEV